MAVPPTNPNPPQPDKKVDPPPPAPPPQTRIEGWVDKLGNPFRTEPTVAQELTEQHHETLKSAYQSIEPQAERRKTASKADSELEAILSGPPEKVNQNSVDRAEQLLVQLLDAESLRTRLLRKLDEAKRLEMPNAPFYEGRIKEEKLDLPGEISTEKEELIRMLLLRLLDEIQWLHKRRTLRRDHAHKAAIRVTRLFLIAMAAFVVLLLSTKAYEVDIKEEKASANPVTNKAAGTTPSPKVPGAIKDPKTPTKTNPAGTNPPPKSG